MLLGAVNGSPLMVAQVYQTLADSGVYRKLTTVTAVLDADKNPLPVTRLPKEQAISPDTDFLIQYAMQ